MTDYVKGFNILKGGKKQGRSATSVLAGAGSKL
jgi:hypothetical protein